MRKEAPLFFSLYFIDLLSFFIYLDYFSLINPLPKLIDISISIKISILNNDINFKILFV